MIHLIRILLIPNGMNKKRNLQNEQQVSIKENNDELKENH